MRRNKPVYLFCLLGLGTILIFICLFSYREYAINKLYENQPYDGTYIIWDEADIDSEYALYSNWEMYPDYLYYSDPSADIPKPVYTSIPQKLNHLSVKESFGNTSYRITVKNVQLFDREGMMLIIPGLLSDYKVFINGEETQMRVMAPWGYPVYPLKQTGDVEIVVEFPGNSSLGLNVVPEVVSLKVAMQLFDTTKMAVMIWATICLSVFILLLITMFISQKRILRTCFITGIIYTFLFLYNLVWSLGYLDLIKQNTSFCTIQWIIFLLKIIGIGQIFYMQSMYIKQPLSSKRVLNVCLGTGCAGFICAFFHEYINGFLMQSVLIFMVICAAVFWIVKSCNYIAEYENYEVFFFETGILFLFAGMIMDCLQILLGTSIHLRYIQPLCSLGYLGCVYLMFLFDQKNSLTKARQLLCLEKEMAAIQSLLLASRLKPHFLYNTLTTIQELCYTDPRKAARMIVKFSNYLRSNMDFMNHTTLIPFETELNHIRNYIAIQKMRFEDELEYKEDISYVDFEIPQLTIQPLIENAIQHGIRKNPLGGCVELICQKQDNYITIIVRNDGSDFTEEAKTSSHSLNTIEKCLSNLLNAVMEISYNPENNKASVTIKINMLTAQR